MFGITLIALGDECPIAVSGFRCRTAGRSCPNGRRGREPRGLGTLPMPTLFGERIV
jgi:hypothetical protein